MSPTMKRGAPPIPRALPRASSIIRDRDVEPDDARSLSRGQEGDVARAAGEIDDVLPARQPRFANQPPLPRSIAPERQQDGDEIVAIGNRREERPDVLPLVLGRREGGAEAQWSAAEFSDRRDIHQPAHHGGVRAAIVIHPPAGRRHREGHLCASRRNRSARLPRPTPESPRRAASPARRSSEPAARARPRETSAAGLAFSGSSGQRKRHPVGHQHHLASRRLSARTAQSQREQQRYHRPTRHCLLARASHHAPAPAHGTTRTPAHSTSPNHHPRDIHHRNARGEPGHARAARGRTRRRRARRRCARRSAASPARCRRRRARERSPRAPATARTRQATRRQSSGAPPISPSCASCPSPTRAPLPC